MRVFNVTGAAALILMVASFTFGVAVVEYHLPPFGIIKSAKNLFVDLTGLSSTTDKLLMKIAFMKPLPDVSEFLYKPVESISDLGAQIDEMKVVPSGQYFEVYSSLKLVSPPQPVTYQILQLSYDSGNGKEAAAYAYYLPSQRREGTCGVLIIPGSGPSRTTTKLYV